MGVSSPVPARNQPDRYGIKNAGKAKWDMEYHVSTFEKEETPLKLGSFNEFSEEVMKSYAGYKELRDKLDDY